jgi:hypothetical protein
MFGPPKTELGFPTTKTEKFGTDQSSDPFKYTDRRNMPVPSQTDRPIYGIRSSKNFITANAVEAILQGAVTMGFYLLCMRTLTPFLFIT